MPQGNNPGGYEPGSEWTEDFHNFAHQFNISPEEAWDSRFSDKDSKPGWRLNRILKQFGVENGIEGFNANDPTTLVDEARAVRKWANDNASGISGHLYEPANEFGNLQQALVGYHNQQNPDNQMSLDPANQSIWQFRMHKALGYDGPLDSQEDMNRLNAYVNMYLDGNMPNDRESFDEFLDTRVEHAAPGLYVEEGSVPQRSYVVYERDDTRHGKAIYKGFGTDDSWWTVGGGRVDLGEDGLLGTDDDTRFGHDQQTYQRVIQAVGGYIDDEQWGTSNIQQEQRSIQLKHGREKNDPWTQVGRLKNNNLREAAYVLGLSSWENSQDVNNLETDLRKLGYSGDEDSDDYWGYIQNPQEVRNKANEWNTNNPDDPYTLRDLDTIRNGTPNEQSWGGGVFESKPLTALQTDDIYGWRAGKGWVYSTDTEHTKHGKKETKYLDFEEFQKQPQWQEAAAALGIKLDNRENMIAALEWMGADTTLAHTVDRDDGDDEYQPSPYEPGVDRWEPEEITRPKALGRMVPIDRNEVRTTSHQLQILQVNEDGSTEYTTGTGDYAYARENLVTLTPKMNIGPAPTLTGSSRRDIANPTGVKWKADTKPSDASVRPTDRYANRSNTE